MPTSTRRRGSRHPRHGVLTATAVLLLGILTLVGAPRSEAASGPTRAQAAPASQAAPRPPVDVLGKDPLRAFAASARSDRPRARIVPLNRHAGLDQPGIRETLHIEVDQRSRSPYADGEREYRLTAPTVTPLRAGHAMVLTFWGRAIRPATAHARLNVGRAGGDNRQSLSVALEFGREWRKYEFPFRVDADSPAGQAQAEFWLGFGPQVLQVAGFSLRDHGPGTPPGIPPVTYAGRQADAPWRAAANARIDAYRKGDLHVSVLDTKGRPVPNASVRVRMREHAFPFGTAVDATQLGTNPTYQNTLKANFNQGILGNDLKWAAWENPQHRELVTLPALRWMRDNGMRTAGHTLIWQGWSRLPSDLQRLRDRPAALRVRVDQHITEEVSALRGQLDVWDVVNEPYAMHVLQDALGPGELARWFELAHRADPRARLIVNDYDILDDQGWNRRHQDHLYNLVRSLRERRVPVHGVGFQAHFAAPQLTPPADLLPILDRYASLGVPIEITEFDVTTTDERLQADYTRDFLTLSFSHQSVASITTWGFWEPLHWSPTAAMYRADWSPKPNAEVWRDLIYRQWWTDVAGRTDSHGEYAARGFLGAYDVSVRVGDSVTRQRVSMPSGSGASAAFVVKVQAPTAPDQDTAAPGGSGTSSRAVLLSFALLLLGVLGALGASTFLRRRRT
ncbi:endo-1,4-beta-xylanase [Actinopolymorpha alba]|uniref:endo-1,4-beta-xylanase n=1 Tax=Actinopolymorpha alba TaxID=533267 RepID=UPI00037C6DEF|nr:endo-1,4-beta-xylanase [Actinopolymorpha alba]